MIFDANASLDAGRFEPALVARTNRLQEVLAAAQRTGSSRIESTHFLLALNSAPGGLTREFFRQQGIASDELAAGLAGCVAAAEPGAEPPTRLEPQSLAASGRALLARLDELLAAGEIDRIDEGRLLLATLENLTPAVVDTLDAVELAPRDLIRDLKELLAGQSEKAPEVFTGERVQLGSFSASGRRTLELAATEAAALGYSEIDPRHLLLAFLEHEGGAIQTILWRQDVSPRGVAQKVMLNLRGRARKKSGPPELHRRSLSFAVRSILERSAEQARSEGSARVAEVHLLRSFLDTPSFALQQLTDAGVDVEAAKAAVRDLRQEEEPQSETGGPRSWQAVRADLEASLVGQQEAIATCLPFLRRMLFGLVRPRQPAGAFLFCGPSGSGKTEMARAMARAVFGDEENLVMLEMGQFQTKESMNIFVGAPPGYVGYGEGKLTNGLRDKPRSVVLFDEVEKAHPEVFDALLRFMDEGRIDDPAGPVRDGSQCLIVLTSNITTPDLEKLARESSSGEDKWEVRRRLKEALLRREDGSRASRGTFRFRPEFLNRIDEILLFHGLGEKELTEIARRQLVEYARRLREEKQIEVTYSPNLAAAAGLIGRFCTTLDEGARAVLRLVATAVLDPVVEFVYDKGRLPPASLVVHFPNEPAREPRGIVGFLDERVG